MRPIKEIQNATHFRKILKTDLVEQGLISKEELESEESDKE
jgi:hypothetical protein